MGMIQKTYYSNADLVKPKNYFERFYKYCTDGYITVNDRFNMVNRLRDELRKNDISLVWHYNSNVFSVIYPSEEDYVIFKLKWS